MINEMIYWPFFQSQKMQLFGPSIDDFLNQIMKEIIQSIKKRFVSTSQFSQWYFSTNLKHVYWINSIKLIYALINLD